MQKNKISLVGTTQGGREFEVDRLFNSLVGTKDFLEVVFVDQSESSVIEEIVNKYRNTVSITLIKSEKLSLSKARNLALREVSGNIIGFCDDDAFYETSQLEKLCEVIKYGEGICCKVIDKNTNDNYGNRSYPSKNVSLSYVGVMKNCLSVGVFLAMCNNQAVKSNIYFDERLGVGTELGGSEETELLFRLLKSGFNIKYENDFFVYHDNDDPLKVNNLPEKYYKYAIGYALIVRKYFFSSYGLLGLEFMRVVFRCLFGLLIPKKRSICMARLKGLMKGLKISFKKVEC